MGLGIQLNYIMFCGFIFVNETVRIGHVIRKRIRPKLYLTQDDKKVINSLLVNLEKFYMPPFRIKQRLIKIFFF